MVRRQLAGSVDATRSCHSARAQQVAAWLPRIHKLAQDWRLQPEIPNEGDRGATEQPARPRLRLSQSPANYSLEAPARRSHLATYHELHVAHALPQALQRLAPQRPKSSRRKGGW